MGCEPIWGPGNRAVGIICSRGRKSAPTTKPCSKCGEPGDLLCDGPHPSGLRGKGQSCDKPICRSCAVSIRAVNVDFCPEHGEQLQPDISGHCPCGSAPGVRCQGITVEKVGGLCLVHAVLFDHWLGHAGGQEVYRGSRPIEEKRTAFREWLAHMPTAGLDMILVARHLR